MMFFIPALILIFILTQLALILYNEHFHPLREFPGPFWHRTTIFPWLKTWLSGNFHHSALRLHEKYGDIVRYAPNELSFISESAIHRVYETESIGRDPRRTPQMTEGQIDLVYYVHEADHVRFRRAFAPVLSGASLLGHEQFIRANTTALLLEIESSSDTSATVNLTQLYDWVSFDIIGELMFGESFGCLKNRKTHQWLALMNKKHLGTYAYIIGIFPWLKKAVYRLGGKKLANIPRKIVKEKCKSYFDSGRTIGCAIEVLTDKDELTQNEIEANLVSFMTAAAERTSGALLAVSYCLARNENCRQKALEELQAAFATADDVSHPKVTKLPYLNAVILETLRLFPGIPMSQARTIIPGYVMIDGVEIPQGTTVRTPQFCAGRYSRHFHKPHEFRPERWLGDKSFEEDHRGVVQPFATGRHACPGRKFAEMALTHILARVLMTFKFQLVDHSRKLEDNRTHVTWERAPREVRVVKI